MIEFTIWMIFFWGSIISFDYVGLLDWYMNTFMMSEFYSPQIFIDMKISFSLFRWIWNMLIISILIQLLFIIPNNGLLIYLEIFVFNQ
jgi:hypothetical protein